MAWRCWWRRSKIWRRRRDRGCCRRGGRGNLLVILAHGRVGARRPRQILLSVPWVSPKDMKVAVIGETEDKVTAAAVEGSSAKYVADGSVLMVMRSGILKHSFPVAVTDRIVTLNQDLRALTPHSGIS